MVSIYFTFESNFQNNQTSGLLLNGNFRTKAIKSVKNVLNFGRRKSCEEKQALFASSKESSIEDQTDQSEDEEGKWTETENICYDSLHERQSCLNSTLK